MCEDVQWFRLATFGLVVSVRYSLCGGSWIFSGAEERELRLFLERFCQLVAQAKGTTQLPPQQPDTQTRPLGSGIAGPECSTSTTGRS